MAPRWVAPLQARVRRLVRPGEVIHYYVEKTQSRGRVWRWAIVDGAARSTVQNSRRGLQAALAVAQTPPALHQ